MRPASRYATRVLNQNGFDARVVSGGMLAHANFRPPEGRLRAPVRLARIVRCRPFREGEQSGQDVTRCPEPGREPTHETGSRS
jgi:hypothetical protein